MNFLIVMVNVNPGLGVQDVQNVLQGMANWYRIAPNLWVLHTNEPTTTWFARLQMLVTPSGTLFISPLNPNGRQGLMPQPFWDWVNQRIAASPFRY